MIHVFLKSSWNSVDPAPKDPILEVTEAFIADPSPDKVNVGVLLLEGHIVRLSFSSLLKC
ncbi:hypothetical protein UlMin_015927 [Ulmus minor]